MKKTRRRNLKKEIWDWFKRINARIDLVETKVSAFQREMVVERGLRDDLRDVMHHRCGELYDLLMREMARNVEMKKNKRPKPKRC